MSTWLNQSSEASVAASMGAIAIDGTAAYPVEQSRRNLWKRRRCRTRIDRLCKTMRQAGTSAWSSLGCAALVGLTAESMSIFPYTELINKEVEIIGVSDHLATELPALIEFARSGKLRFPPETLRVVNLNASQINAALDALQDSIDHVRTVIVPSSDK